MLESSISAVPCKKIEENIQKRGNNDVRNLKSSIKEGRMWKSKKTMKRSTLSFHTSFLSHCLDRGITLTVSVILQTTGHANLLCFVSTTWNLHACLCVYASGTDKFSHPTLALPPFNAAVSHLSKFWLFTKPSVPNLNSIFVETLASQCLQLVQLECVVRLYATCYDCAPLCPASPQLLRNVHESFDLMHRTGIVAGLFPIAIHFCDVAPHPQRFKRTL